MWRDGTEKTRAKYKISAGTFTDENNVFSVSVLPIFLTIYYVLHYTGDAVKNRARAVKAHLGGWYTHKTLDFPSFKRWRGLELDTSSITDSLSELKCENFEWYLKRFKYIYRDAGVLPSEVFQIAPVQGDGSELCLELKSLGWTNFGNNDEIALKKCEDTHTEPKSQWWHRSGRLDDGSCCGSLRAWNTDQCINGLALGPGAKKILTHTCDLDLGVEASLKPSNKDGELLLKIGRSENCISLEEGSKLTVVPCKAASKWRIRKSFAPIEYDLLSNETKAVWAGKN